MKSAMLICVLILAVVSSIKVVAHPMRTPCKDHPATTNILVPTGQPTPQPHDSTKHPLNPTTPNPALQAENTKQPMNPKTPVPAQQPPRPQRPKYPVNSPSHVGVKPALPAQRPPGQRPRPQDWNKRADGVCPPTHVLQRCSGPFSQYLDAAGQFTCPIGCCDPDLCAYDWCMIGFGGCQSSS